jgi:hypothetical protein
MPEFDPTMYYESFSYSTSMSTEVYYESFSYSEVYYDDAMLEDYLIGGDLVAPEFDADGNMIVMPDGTEVEV